MTIPAATTRTAATVSTMGIGDLCFLCWTSRRIRSSWSRVSAWVRVRRLGDSLAKSAREALSASRSAAEVKSGTSLCASGSYAAIGLSVASVPMS